MFMKILVSTLGLVLLVSCTGTGQTPKDPPPIDPIVRGELSSWLEKNGESPISYVTGLFSDHDVVFLGEQHRVKHDPVFVQSVIPAAYKAGVRILAFEFGRREDQQLIDSLVTRREWDEGLARDIMFRQFIWWGYREYIDIYKAAWELNRSLPGGETPFRILGLNDSPDWSFVETKTDRNDPEVMKKVWQGGGEDHWADVILEAVASGEKVLVYSGIHHAFTEYRQPIVANGDFVRFDKSLRCGNHVYNKLGKRAVTIFLHAPWHGREGYGSVMRHPADGIIDALMLADGPRPVGFNIGGSPFGRLQIQDAVYCHGYEDFKLGDFCDGWIYTKPISEFEGVTPVPEWINEGNIEHARAQSSNPAFREASAEKFNRGIERDAEIPRRWGHLR
jgi:hypothetical protein